MQQKQLSWRKSDIEGMLGFRPKKYTGTNTFFTFILAVILTLAFYGILHAVRSHVQENQMIEMFFHGGSGNRSTIPYYTVLFAAWCCAILFVKWRKIALQRRALRLDIVPTTSEFVLSPVTAGQIIARMYELVDNPRQFILLNRIERAVSNLKNLGRVSDVSAVMTMQADNDDQYVESSYTLLKGFIWAIPVLGFIGTVLGLSQAVGGFGVVVGQGAGVEKLKESLGGVTSGLAVAFETTLIALVAALGIQIIMTMIKKNEEDFLDECSDYCHRHIVSKLRTVGVESETE